MQPIKHLAWGQNGEAAEKEIVTVWLRVCYLVELGIERLLLHGSLVLRLFVLVRLQVPARERITHESSATAPLAIESNGSLILSSRGGCGTTVHHPARSRVTTM